MRLLLKKKLKNISLQERVKFLNKVSSKNKTFYNLLVEVFGIGHYSAKEVLKLTGFSFFIKAGKIPVNLLNFISDFLLNYLLVERGLRRYRNSVLLNYKNSGNIRGLRLFNGLPVNGQRSHTNARTVRRLFKFYKVQDK
jgi:small subunit ribosomal protein S13